MDFLSVLGLKPKSVVIDDRRPASLHRLIQKLESAEFQEAEGLLAGASDENMECLIYGFADAEDSVELASTWTRAKPESSMAHTVLGASLVVTGWKIRGANYAEDVDGAAWQPFLDQLGQARKTLQRAAQLDQSSAASLAWLILAELGCDGERDELARLFAEANARVPLHWPAHWKYFMVTTEKWGGSHRGMFDFVNEVSAKAGKGSLLHSLVAAAFCEFALAEGDAGLRKIRTPENAERVRSALYKCLAATPETLDEKLEQISGGFSGQTINYFAVACYLCGAINEARSLVKALHDEIESVPWAWIGKGFREDKNPGFVFDRVKRELARA